MEMEDGKEKANSKEMRTQEGFIDSFQRIAKTLNNVRQAVARGWCHPQNEKKIMDADLAEAISYEVTKSILFPSPKPQETK